MKEVTPIRLFRVWSKLIYVNNGIYRIKEAKPIKQFIGWRKLYLPIRIFIRWRKLYLYGHLEDEEKDMLISVFRGHLQDEGSYAYNGI